MPIHDLALRVMDRLIERAEENKQRHGHWWEDEPVVMTPPTPEEAATKLASVKRRLQKAEQAWTAALTPEELADHHFMKADPKSMEEVDKRKQILKKLYAALDQDGHKLNLYRQYKKLEDQHNHLISGTSSIIYDEDELSDDPKTAKAAHSFQLAVDFPDEVETNQTASAITRLIYTAMGAAGYGAEPYGFTTPVAYFDKNKFVLEIDDGQENFRFDPEPLKAVDWRKIREALVALKPVVESGEGWRRRPTSQGEIFEKTDNMNDLQLRILLDQIVVDWDDVSHWDTWRPELPGRKRIEPLNVIHVDKHGQPVALNSLPRLHEEGDEMKYLDEPKFEPPETGGWFGDLVHSLRLDTSDVHLKAIATLDAAERYLRDFIGIKGLDLEPPSRDSGTAVNL